MINDLSDYKVQAQVDEHYIDRVKPGLNASFVQNGKHYLLQVRKVYPEVRDGRFRIDFVFKGVRPDNIRTGQTYYVDLQLGQSKNPQYYEVIEGLEPGEQVIVSGYEAYKDNDVLVIN